MTSWVDGRIVGDGEPSIPSADRGFLYGDGLFETLRVQDGAPLWWDEHLRRMAQGAAELGIPMPPEPAWRAAALALLDGARGRCRLRLVLTRGDGPPGFAPPPKPDPRMVLTFDPATLPEPPRLVALVRSGEPGLPRLKILAAPHAVLARREAARRGADDALLVDRRGRVVEATSATVLVARGGRLVTPPLSDGILPGVTRSIVLAWAQEAGVACEEASLYLGDVRGADEILLASSVAGVLPARAVDGRELPAREGPLARRVSEAFERACREVGPRAWKKSEKGNR
ncbi:MAG TPA: aminotransferase class IV [Candidatus Thermoplasmatota archaeon]|nr:aminotransferase class IV [Candidatus Thermoplasmatota archaeon]